MEKVEQPRTELCDWILEAHRNTYILNLHKNEDGLLYQTLLCKLKQQWRRLIWELWVGSWHSPLFFSLNLPNSLISQNSVNIMWDLLGSYIKAASPQKTEKNSINQNLKADGKSVRLQTWCPLNDNFPVWDTSSKSIRHINCILRCKDDSLIFRSTMVPSFTWQSTCRQASCLFFFLQKQNLATNNI